MSTITGSNIATRVRHLLQDSGGIRWDDAELLLYINDAQREIAYLKPDASSANDIVKLRVNTTKQTLSGVQKDGSGTALGGNRLLRVIRNIHSTDFTDTSGVGAGSAIRRVDRRILDTQFPNWHDPSEATGDAAFISTGGNIKNYIFDEIDPETFYVFPGVASGQNVYIEIVYSKVPDDLGSIGATISIPDIYANAIVDYVCYRATSKEAEYAANAQRSVNHYNAFATALGTKSRVDVVTSPNEANQKIMPAAAAPQG